MNYKRTLIYIIVAALLLSSCTGNNSISIPDSPMVFEWEDTEGNLMLVYGDKQYEAYANIEPKLVGDCIGYYTINDKSGDGIVSDEPIYICQLKGYNSDEWIVDVINPGNCSEGTIWKEKSVTDIPDALTELDLCID